jgi:predicted nucleotidyltransferase
VTHRSEQHASASTSTSPERAAEIEDVIERVTRWAVDRKDVLGLLLVGSCARYSARPDSDIDLVLLTEEIARYADNAWADELNLGTVLSGDVAAAIRELKAKPGGELQVHGNRR